VILTALALVAMTALAGTANAQTGRHRAKGAARHCAVLRNRARRQRCARQARYRRHHTHHSVHANRTSAGADPLAASPPAPTSPPPAAPQTCTGTETIPTSSNLEEVRTATLCLINRERELHGESALTENPKLQAAAQGHSEDMIARNYFNHTTPSGEAFGARILASGYVQRDQTYMIGENIDTATLYLATPAATVTAWMNSPEHRENILNGEFRDSGIGVIAAAPASFAEGQQGATYTQDFGVIAS
jgi:uncharacterized protein YkwD